MYEKLFNSYTTAAIISKKYILSKMWSNFTITFFFGRSLFESVLSNGMLLGLMVTENYLCKMVVSIFCFL